MAQVVNANQVKLNDGKVVQAQQGGWYDGQQFWGGTLSQAGQINVQSNQQGAGQAVSREVIAQTNPANVAYIDQQRQQQNLPPSPSVQTPVSQPSSVSTVGGATGTGLGAGGGIGAPEAINLPKLYESLYASSGIRDLESSLNEKTNAYNATVSKIKDNPYLSEATMTGRIDKLDSKFRADAQLAQNEIAMKKADVETQLNLQTKQFDINSQQAQQALQQFNSLLSSGALDNANGEDIANLTRSTGIPSSMIQSAISLSRQKNTPKAEKLDTQVITTTNDAGVVTATVINTQTGDVINKSSLGTIGNAQQGAQPKAASESEKVSYYQDALRQDASRGVELPSIFKLYTGYLDPSQILSLYNANSMYGPADTNYWTPERLAQYGVKTQTTNNTGY